MPKNIYRRGDTYYGRYSVNGELQRVSLRTADLREARERLRAVKKKAEEHALGVTIKATWEEAVMAYVSGVLDAGSVKPGTAKRYEVSLRQLGPAFDGKRLARIGVAEIGAYVSERQKAKATNATIRRDLTTMSRVLAYAKANGMVPVNAAEGYDRKLIRERREVIHAPSDEVVAQAVAKAEGLGRPELAALLRFLRATGLRAGEATRAEWKDRHGSTLTILETKNGRVRTIEVPDSAWPEGSKGRLFPSLPLDSGQLSHTWGRVREAKPVGPTFRLHDLRHAYAIGELRAGRDIYDLSHHLGHSSVRVTEIYLGYVPGGRAKGRTG